MTNYIKVKDNTYLISEKFQNKTKEVKFREKRNIVFVFDRSGSMYSTLPNLIEDMIRELDNFSPDDYFTAGWFSSVGEYQWLLKGTPISQKEAIARTLRKYKNATNLTCFYEILTDLENVIEDLTPLASNFSFMFLSDGNDNQGQEKVKKALNNLAPKLGLSIVTGYGDWYCKERMADIAQSLGGVLVHSSNLSEFSRHFANFRESSESSEPKVELVGNFSDRSLMLAITDKNDIVSFDMSSEKFYAPVNTQKLVYLSSKPSDIEKNPDDLATEIYAVSRALLQNGDYSTALEVLALVGDVAPIDTINNSFTVSEYGTAENFLLDAAFDEGKRYTKGRKVNYVVRVDAFSLLDLLEVLTKDQTAQFLPYHPEFKYRKIGRPSKTKGEFPKFEADENVGVYLNSLVWNSEELNIGVRAKIPGKVQLDDKASSLDLNKDFDTYIYRTYNVVFDGKRNVDTLPVKNLSQETIKILRKNEVISIEDGSFFVLDLTKIPVINRALAENYRNLENVCDKLLEETILQVENKVFGYLYKQFPDELKDKVEDLVKEVKFRDEQVVYLEQFGVKKDGSFGPPTEQLPATDFLPVKKVEFGIAKLNSIPTIPDTLEKIEKAQKAGKKLTSVQSLIWQSYNDNYIAKFNGKTTEAEKALYLKESIERNRKQLAEIRAETNKAKAAIYIGKSTFDKWPKPEAHNEYEYKGYTFTLDITDSKVEI